MLPLQLERVTEPVARWGRDCVPCGISDQHVAGSPIWNLRDVYLLSGGDVRNQYHFFQVW